VVGESIEVEKFSVGYLPEGNFPDFFERAVEHNLSIRAYAKPLPDELFLKTVLKAASEAATHEAITEYKRRYGIEVEFSLSLDDFLEEKIDLLNSLYFVKRPEHITKAYRQGLLLHFDVFTPDRDGKPIEFVKVNRAHEFEPGWVTRKENISSLPENMQQLLKEMDVDAEFIEEYLPV
jgi:hypothetical protein